MEYAQLARGCGMGGTAETIAVRNLRNGLIRLRRELGLPDTLSAAGIQPGHLRQKMESVASAALADPCCATNPVSPTAGDIRRLLQGVMGNG